MIRIPQKQQCIEIIREMEVPGHIVMHSIQVSRVGLFLVDAFAIAGIELNRNLVRAGALLHDITKFRSLSTGELHDQTGREVLIQKGFPEVGDIVGQHVRLFHDEVHSLVSEAEIVNYADKRVMHENIVPMNVRMAYIKERYGKTQQHRDRIQKLWKKTAILETKLLQRIPEHLLIIMEQYLQQAVSQSWETELTALFNNIDSLN